ncbi:MAG: hypothetical protein KKH83_07530 [Candidatus Margulisbacteria bacterium]|nr:hypothetical protein [Candidatus Margulisiibacteriota bacterium]
MSDNFKVEFYCRPEKLKPYGSDTKTQAENILRLINENFLLSKVEEGKVTIVSKHKDGSTSATIEAMTLVQKALSLLCLFHPRSDTEWGVYGDTTIAAIRRLQREKPIDSDGQFFGISTFAALKNALIAIKEGRNWKLAVKNSEPPKKAAPKTPSNSINLDPYNLLSN